MAAPIVRLCGFVSALGVIWSAIVSPAAAQLDSASGASPATLTQVNAAAPSIIALGVGSTHSCAVTSAGAVQCWGDNASGELGDGTLTSRPAPAPAAGFVGGATALALGFGFTCALTNAGAVWCWGSNGAGELGDGTTSRRLTPVSVDGLSGSVAAIAAGSGHTCALISGGAVQCWGGNQVGQLGIGTKVSQAKPVTVDGLSGAVRITAGARHTCAVTSATTARCWGVNRAGQLGNNSTVDSLVPVDVSGLSGVVAIAGGTNHTCALLSAGTVWCWGNNAFGQLGDGTTTQRLVPTQVSGLGGVIGLSAGGEHSCAVTSAGAVWCWGDNSFGQLGDGTTTGRPTPVIVSGLSSGVVAVAAGGDHTCALTSAGTLRCWGFNSDGQLGNAMPTDRPIPAGVNGPAGGAIGLVAGFSHTCALISGGTVSCWGRNGSGQLGDGTTLDRQTPTNVLNINGGATALAAGWDHTCALMSAGDVWCWGWNGVGQLGDTTRVYRQAPVPVSGLSSAVAIAAGDAHTCALLAGGTVKCWGGNYAGELGNGTTANSSIPVDVVGLSGVVAIAAGDAFSCALLAGGAVRCWGANDVGQLGDGTKTSRPTTVGVSGLPSGVIKIAAGEEHACALTSAGAVWCWGDNSFGQLGNGILESPQLSPVEVQGLSGSIVGIATGSSSGHTCALTSGGAVQCWGNNVFGQLGDATTISPRLSPVDVAGLGSGASALATGIGHTCALMSGGKVECWGDKGDGTLGDGSANRQVTPMDVAWLTYSISGRVAANDGIGIPAVRITADTGNRTTTDASGNFVLAGLPAASYTISAWKPGFALSSPLQVKLTTSDVGGQSFTATPLPDTILDVRYVDQVFVQQSLENGYWNDCGPSSVAMMMHYYGVESRDVFTDRQPALDLVPKVKYGGTGGSNWGLINDTFAAAGFAFSLKPTMDEQEIRDSIHHGHPVILSVTNPSHVFVINGVKSNGTLVIQDPMGAKSWNAGATSDLRRNDTPWLGAGHFNPPRTKGQGVEYSYAELVAKGFVRLLRVTGVALPPAPVTATVNTAGGRFQGNRVRIDFAPSAQTQAQAQQGGAQTLRITASAQLGPRQSISGFNAAIASFRVDAATMDGAPVAQADATFKMTVSIDPAILSNWDVTGGSTPGPDGTLLQSSPGPMPIDVALALAYWNTTTQRWDLLPTIVDTPNSQVIARTNHFGEFAVLIRNRTTIFLPGIRR